MAGSLIFLIDAYLRINDKVSGIIQGQVKKDAMVSQALFSTAYLGIATYYFYLLTSNNVHHKLKVLISLVLFSCFSSLTLIY